MNKLLILLVLSLSACSDSPSARRLAGWDPLLPHNRQSDPGNDLSWVSGHPVSPTPSAPCDNPNMRHEDAKDNMYRDNVDSVHSYTVGDKVTITMGFYKGCTGSLDSYDSDRESYSGAFFCPKGNKNGYIISDLILSQIALSENTK